MFGLFFAVGLAAMSLSFLCDELLTIYNNTQLLKAIETSTNRLQALNTDYDALLKNLRKDPNLTQRLGPAVLGSNPTDTNTAYPKAKAEQLAAARKTLTQQSTPQPPPRSMLHDYIIRCCEPRRQIILFISGAALIIISFICFGQQKNTPKKQIPTTRTVKD